MRNVLIIGGGAAGMMAAIRAAEKGARVTVLERNEKLGKKVYITGKGRCNVTNDCTVDEFMREVPRNPRFLYSALTAFTPQQMMMLLEDAGCPVVTERGRRVFPASQKASDITRALTKLMEQNGVRVRYHSRVRSIEAADGKVRSVTLESGEALPADAVIIATGGLSCPLTGSTGDGYRLAGSLGHTIQPTRPSLSAIDTEDRWPGLLAGLSLKNVTLTAKMGRKTLYSDLGEMLFTHTGISGPLVLTLSAHLPENIADADVKLDLKPGLDQEQLMNRLKREFTENPRKKLRSVLCSLLPVRLAEAFPGLCGADGEEICCQVSRAVQDSLCRTMKALPLHLKKLAPVEEAVITRGGVTVKEVNPSTMESKLVRGLYFAGEVLDVDAHTGGYNLHIAFATGRTAGQHAAENTED